MNGTKKIGKLLWFVVIVGLIMLYGFLRPYFVYKYHAKELDIIIDELAQTDIYAFHAAKTDPIQYYSAYSEIDDTDVSEDLKAAIDEVYKDHRIRYIGYGCPINGVLFWDQLYVGFDDEGKKYLVYCPDPYGLPDHTDYGPIRCRWVADDWYYIYIWDRKQVLT